MCDHNSCFCYLAYSFYLRFSAACGRRFQKWLWIQSAGAVAILRGAWVGHGPQIFA